MDQKRLLMNISLAVAVLMLVGKIAAYLITGSTAILSDAAESVVHIFATGFASLSLWFAERPPDPKHPYGHGRIMSFSVGIEGMLIFSAALFILMEAAIAIVNGPQLHKLDYGLLITGGLAAINLALGLSLIRVGKKHNAPILVANGQHVLSDMWTSIAVVVGVFLVWMTGITIIDPLFAIGAALVILYTGGTLIREAIMTAMDAASPEDTQLIKTALDELVTQNVITAYHQLRHRRVNAVHWIEVHLLVPGGLTVRQAHQIATRAETRIDRALGTSQVFVTSHVEPDDHDQAHPEGHHTDPLLEN